MTEPETYKIMVLDSRGYQYSSLAFVAARAFAFALRRQRVNAHARYGQVIITPKYAPVQAQVVSQTTRPPLVIEEKP